MSFTSEIQRLLEASKKGDIESVQNLLSKKEINVNSRDILIKKHS